MKNFFNNILFSVFIYLLTSFSPISAQIKVIEIPGTDSTIVINIEEIKEEAKRIAKEAKKIAAEVQIEEMEEFIKIMVEAPELEDIDIQIDQEAIEAQIRKAEAQIRMHQAEIERAAREAQRPYHRMEYTNFVSSFKLDYNGKIELSEDEDDIKSISKDGKFIISKSTFGNKRKVSIRPNANGQLEYKFYVGNSEVPYDPDGKKWLSDILPEVIKSSTIAAESRLNKRMKEGGVDKALRYISEISGQSNQVTFYRLLISRKDISADELVKITKDVTRNVSSSSELSDYFKESFAIYNNKKGLSAYFNGIKSISSSYEKSDCLTEIIESSDIREGFNENHWEQWLKATQTITSSYEASKTLQEAFNYDASGMPARTLEQTIKLISSSYEKANTIEAAFSEQNRKKWSEDQNNALLFAAKSISSSYELKNTLEEALESWKYWSEETKNIFFQVASSISSSSEKASLLSELEDYKIEHRSNIHNFYMSIRSISSSYDMASVLEDIASSSHFHEGHYEEYLNATTHISSSYDMRDALEEIAPFIAKSKDDSLIQLYKEKVKLISSSHDREKAMEALEK
ncbi:hypothetical protein [Flammeovirga sp. SJP92]|uniref:hypothetical protein n=1 Tax=Flammeovirga sp. SJP92 TaxID=1775430 RepID=UPI0007884949|nr:hypothetical protein [Flammeovirga sp. SJP92]KXX70998.1 hypothetical protein AVL50_10370 [Flammeovirga sp. SJP92]